jgi:hypothetical protein
MLSYIGVRKWVGNPLVAYDFVPEGGVIDGSGAWVGFTWFELYTSIQPANAGDAPLAQEIWC